MTENYSVLSPEVPELGGQAVGAFNAPFFKMLMEYDRVYVFGQAKTHCVLSTLRRHEEHVKQTDPALADKICILEDAMSPVPPPPIDPLPAGARLPAHRRGGHGAVRAGGHARGEDDRSGLVLGGLQWTVKSKLRSLFSGAAAAGTLSPQTATLLTGNLGPIVDRRRRRQGARRHRRLRRHAHHVLIDASSSIIADRDLEQAVRDGQNQLVDAFAGAKRGAVDPDGAVDLQRTT